LYTARRAEDYAGIGRPDRAARAYRRILMAHPGDAGIAARLQQLAHDAPQRPDDLSEELADPALVPPEPPPKVDMPLPRSGPTVPPAESRQATPAPAESRQATPAPAGPRGEGEGEP
jgi:hypothetical protein